MKENSACGAAWGVGNVLVTFAAAGRRSRAQNRDDPEVTLNTTAGVSTEVGLSKLTWETTLYQPVFRKLVNESARTFLALQKMMTNEEGERVSAAQLGRVSKQYRSIMRDCQELLDKWADDEAADDEAAANHAENSEVLYKLELMWNLVEILCVDKSGGLVLPGLLQWIALHFPGCDEKARRVLGGADADAGGDAPESHPDYWDAVLLYVVQGRTENARKLLRLHADVASGPFASLDELMRKMPRIFESASASSAASFDFEFRWRHWQSEVVSRIEEGDFAAFAELTTLAKILAGNEAVFQEEVLPRCETWYEWMIGKLLYTSPAVKAYELPFHAEDAISRFGGLGSMTTLDSVLFATMELDVPQVMHELCNSLDNFWFPAHLLDLLHHAGQLENSPANDQLQAGESLREFLLLEYATCLMSHNSLWQVGVAYLDQCPAQGRYRLELLLERVPLTSDRKAEKVLQLANERGLSTVAASTCKVMGMKSFRKKQIGNAMTWALRSQDSNFTTFLADKLLELFCESGSFSSGDLLDHLGSSMVVSDRLMFLAKYREFHGLAAAGNFFAAASLLHSLLWSRLSPKYFWVTLLIDTLPFLTDQVTESIHDGRKIYFSSEQTYELMHCLHELTHEADDIPIKQRTVLSEHEHELRRKLARNLAVALMFENDKSLNESAKKSTQAEISAC